MKHVRSCVLWASGEVELHHVAHIRPTYKGTLCGIETRPPEDGVIWLSKIETGRLPVCRDCEAEAGAIFSR